MPSRLFSVVFIAALVLGIGTACSGSQDQSTTPLKERERSKIDPDLLRLMADSVTVTDVPVLRRPDGTRAYAVWVRASALDALRDAGVSTDSIKDGRVWARLSLAEIREVARLDPVDAIEADNKPVPRVQPND